MSRNYVPLSKVVIWSPDKFAVTFLRGAPSTLIRLKRIGDMGTLLFSWWTHKISRWKNVETAGRQSDSP